MTETYTTSFKYGWNAYVDGLPLYQNPYELFTDDFFQWLKGWEAAREDEAINIA